MSAFQSLKARVFLFPPLLMLLIIAVACGEDATSTPRPTATSVPTAVPPTATPTTAAVQPTATPTTAAMQPTATARPTATPTPVPTPTSAPVAMMAKVDRVILATAPPLREGLMPWLSTELMFMVRPMYESIISVDPSTGVHIPQLATKWEVGPGAKSWTITLREDVPFHFGWGEFTANDVVYAWERLVSETSIASDRDIWSQVMGSVDDFDLVGDHQLVFNVNRPEPDLDFRLATRQGNYAISSKAQFDEEGELGMQAQPAGTGAYVFKEYEPNAIIVYERVEDHWRVTPEFRELEIRIVREDATKLAALLAGETHMTDLPKDLQDSALAAGKKRVQANQTKMGWVAFWGGLYFADGKADLSVPWTDVKVREALNRAVDREEMLETIFHGRGSMAGPYAFLDYTQGWDPSWMERLPDEYGYDPDLSRELLADAGYADGFELKIYNYPSSYPELEQVFEALAQYFIAVGVNAKVIDVDYGTIREPLRERRLDGMMGWGPYITGNPHTVISLSYTIGGGFSQYDHPFIEEKIAELNQSADPVVRDRIQREIGEHKWVNYTEIPLFNVPEEVIIDPEVIAEYLLSGAFPDLWTHLELMKAVKG